MRKILAIIASVLVFATPVLAQTTVDTYWSGGGYFDTTFTAGDDAQSYFETSGAGIMGEFHGKDYDDNPYGYNVDTVDSFVYAAVANGYMLFTNDRLDSKTSMYGGSGQNSYTFIGTDGTGEMSWGSRTNYAEMSNCQYGRSPKTASGKNFEASGSSYVIDHGITDADGDGAQVLAYGSGSSVIKLQGEKSGDSWFNMGSLPVCGDNCAWDNNYATFSGSGSGGFEVHAWADNGLSVCANCAGKQWSIPGDGSDDSATYDLHVGYSGSWSMPDFGIKGN